MKKDIIENPYTKKLGASLRVISNIAFGISIVLSAVFYNTTSQTTIQGWGLVGDIWYYATFVGCIGFAYVLAMYGVKNFAAFLFFESHAARTGRARNANPEMMPTMKFIAFVGIAAVVTFEAYSAYNGGAITAQIFTPKIEGIASGVVSLEQKKAEALAPLRNKVSDIEARMAQEVEEKTKGLKDLLKKGNQWAKNEKAAIVAPIEKAYEKELKAASAALEKENTYWAGIITTATNTDSKKVARDIARADKQEVIYGNLLKIAALLSLFLGLAMEYALAANEVAKRVRPLTDAEALAIERERDERRATSPIAAIANAIKGLGSAGKAGEARTDNGVGKPMF